MTRTPPSADQGQTWDAPAPPLFTVWGCPLMTRVTSDHPYFFHFKLKVPLMQMELGQIANARLGTSTYSVERVR